MSGTLLKSISESHCWTSAESVGGVTSSAGYAAMSSVELGRLGAPETGAEAPAVYCSMRQRPCPISECPCAHRRRQRRGHLGRRGADHVGAARDTRGQDTQHSRSAAREPRTGQTTATSGSSLCSRAPQCRRRDAQSPSLEELAVRGLEHRRQPPQRGSPLAMSAACWKGECERMRCRERASQQTFPLHSPFGMLFLGSPPRIARSHRDARELRGQQTRTRGTRDLLLQQGSRRAESVETFLGVGGE